MMEVPSRPTRGEPVPPTRPDVGLSKNRARGSLQAARPWVFILLGLAIIAAEVVTAFVGSVQGTLFHALLVLAFLNLGGLPEVEPNRRWPIALALVPLMRVLSLTMPVPQLPEYWSYGFVGVPVLCAVFIAAHLLGYSGEALGLRRGTPVLQVIVAGCGLVLGAAAAWVARPDLLVPTLATGNLLVALAMLILAGFAEEALFRGLLLSVATDVLGRPAPFFAAALSTSVLSAAMYLSSGSVPYILLMAVVAQLFAIVAGRTRSIWGVGVAHGLLNASAVLFWPLFLR